ncbi:MAG: hypothetical protein AB7O43_21505 [Hyphomicrobiaceae bacterium]
MFARRHGTVIAFALAVWTAAPVTSASAQSSVLDRIGDLIRSSEPARNDRSAQSTPPATSRPESAPAAGPATPKDPRQGEASYEQARRLMQAIDSILKDTAQQRSDARKLPSKDDYLLTPLWTETRQDREQKVRALLDAALGIITDVPIVDVQKQIEQNRRNIRELEDAIVKLRERQLTAPKDALLPGILNDTVDSLAKQITDTEQRIKSNRQQIADAKSKVAEALQRSDVKLTRQQVDLLLDSVLSGDLVRLVAVFDGAKAIDTQLGKLMAQSGENLNAARKYFAMHAALFALLVHAQDTTIAKIDTRYMPRLDAIMKDLQAAKQRTAELLRAENRPDQLRVLKSNQNSQKLTEQAAKGYRRYLLQQREQIASARKRAAHDLGIADNTYETVEASFQLRNLMRESTSSFEAIQKLEAPTFEQIFKNEELRREFENLTRKLDAPSS